jgi:hypothetical protein
VFASLENYAAGAELGFLAAHPEWENLAGG